MTAEDEARGETQAEGQRPQGKESSAPASGGSGVGVARADRALVKRVIEALLFSSDRPVSAGRLAELSGADDGHQAREIVRELQREYDAQGRAFGVEEIAGGFQLLTRAEFAAHVSRLHNRRQQESLSKEALHTLAIVAYRQPITRAEVEDIRGVQSGHILRSLVEKRLLKVTGRSEELGRPLLYGTTRHFLEVFGLRSLRDLPRRGGLGPPAGEREPGGGAGAAGGGFSAGKEGEPPSPASP